MRASSLVVIPLLGAGIALVTRIRRGRAEPTRPGGGLAYVGVGAAAAGYLVILLVLLATGQV